MVERQVSLKNEVSQLLWSGVVMNKQASLVRWVVFSASVNMSIEVADFVLNHH